MKRFSNRYHFFVLCACLWMATAGGGAAQQVVGVLSSELRPYQEAFEGFREAFGQPVSCVLMDSGRPEVGPQTQVVVAFGGRAALARYAEGMGVIYCLAPGARLEKRGAFVSVEVKMLPHAGYVVSKVKAIQPGIRRLGMVWASDAMSDDVEEISRASAAFGLEVIAERVGGMEDLPDRLRKLLQHGVEGIWLPPDPLLINARSFALLKALCWSNDIPFYVPTAGLVEQGAVAAISVSFREVGRAAGRVARQVLSGERVPWVVYPEVVEMTVNLTAAAAVGLKIPPNVVAQANRVLP